MSANSKRPRPSSYYPAFLDLSNKNVLVVGAGPIAYRKIVSLLECGAKVTVVATRISKSVARLAPAKEIKISCRAFRTEDLNGKELVVCSTDDETLNKWVGRLCQGKKIFVNVVDRPEHCSFIVPAVVRRGDITFAISTGGSSPALAKFLKGKVQDSFGKEINDVAQALKKYRKKLLELSMAQRKKFLQKILNNASLAEIRKRGIQGFEKKLAQGVSHGKF